MYIGLPTELRQRLRKPAHAHRSVRLRVLKRAFLVITLAAVFAACLRTPDRQWPYDATEPAATGAEAMIASDAPEANAAGITMLKSGGNAIDAAVAAAFALAVVYPEAGNVGGGGFMTITLANGTEASIDFREAAPLAATHDMYIDSSGMVSPASLHGHLASGVPGSVAGLAEAHRKFGTLPWRQVLSPAIVLAEQGFTVNERVSRNIRSDAARLAGFPASAALFLPNGTAPQAGDNFRNPDLARVLQRIAERGPVGFYQGETADLIVREMARGGGLITHDDLRQYAPRWRTPVTFSYRGYRVVSAPLASSGGITLALIAGILEGYDLRSGGWHSALTLHLMAESMRRAFAIRNAVLGDPEFARIPVDSLLSAEHIRFLRAGIDPDHATPSSDIGPPLALGIDHPHTTHLSVVDPHGNAVALTTTLNDLHGCGVTVAGAGFLLNDEMDDFAAKPGTPNMFGLVQGKANSIAPGKRMLSAMTPTVVLDSLHKPFLITGARGGPRIITATFQVVSNVIDYGMSLPEAVYAPRIHHQHLPDSISYEESGFSPSVLDALKARGHRLQTVGSVASAPTILRRNGRWLGTGDPRTAGTASGY